MDGVFNYYFVTHSLLSMLMTEFRKSVSIWQSYVQKYIGTFSVHGVGYRIISETWAYWTDLSEIQLVNRHHKYDHESDEATISYFINRTLVCRLVMNIHC